MVSIQVHTHASSAVFYGILRDVFTGILDVDRPHAALLLLFLKEAAPGQRAFDHNLRPKLRAFGLFS